MLSERMGGQDMVVKVPDRAPSTALIAPARTAQSVRPSPQGLAGIPDSIHVPSEPQKPNLFKRIVITFGLGLIHLVIWAIHVYNWILHTVFGYSSRQKIVYGELQHIASTGNTNEIEEFLIEHAQEATAAGFLCGEFVFLPELYAYLTEILRGANVSLCQDRGFFCDQWKQHPDCYRRISSHQYQTTECYAIGHFLFWLDLTGNTRFQFEKSPLQGWFNTIHHIIDFLRYKRDDEQQGVTGVSPYTESRCLMLTIDPKAYLARRTTIFTSEES